MSLSLHITPAQSKADIQAFLDLPYQLYRGFDAWHPPLRYERRDQLDSAKNPIAASVKRQFFLARRGGVVVGRIAALMNPAHIARHNDNAGHFGYFDCEANLETGQALLQRAEAWVKEQGLSKIIGPTSHSVNEESGLLIDGFAHPPVLLMPFGRPDYQTMIEGAGFGKAIDLLAYQSDLQAGYPRLKITQTMVKAAQNDKALSFRTLDKRRFREEVGLVMDIFNDAWVDNWGFIPLTDEQISHMARELKPLIFAEGLHIGMIDGQAVGFIWMVPNVNEAVRDLDGRLWPLGWAKLITRLKITGVKTARIPLMGLRREHQNSRRGLSLIAKLCEDVFAAGRAKGITHCELSWILETNKSMIRICEQAKAVPYKTYRMYEKFL